MLKDSAFQNKWIAVFQLGFQVRKILETYVKQDPGLAENGRELGQKWWKTMRGSRQKKKQTNNNNKTSQQQEQQKTSQNKTKSRFPLSLSLASFSSNTSTHDRSHVISINRGS